MKDAYSDKINFMSSPQLKKALDKYAEKEGVNPSIIGRKAIYEYLKQKGALDPKEKYL